MNTTQKLQETPSLLLDDRVISTYEIVNALKRRGSFKEIIKELILDDILKKYEINAESKEKLIKTYKENNIIETDDEYKIHLKGKILDENLLIDVLSRPQKIVKYREDRWGHQANSIYLKHKEKYDIINFKKLQSNNPDIMQEVYFRLKDKEETWKNLFEQLTGKREENGEVSRYAAKDINPALLRELRKTGPGIVLKPQRIGELVIVAELISIESSSFDDKLRASILNEEFQTWLDESSDKQAKNARFV